MAKTSLLIGLMALVYSGINALTQPVRLNHVGWFDLKERLPEGHRQKQIKVRGFVANNTGLYFLIVARPGPAQEIMIVHTDRNGELLKTIWMPVESELVRTRVEMDVDDNGNCYVLQTIRDPSGGKNEFLVYDRYGNATNTFGVTEPIETFCLQGKSLWYLSGNNELRRLVASQLPDISRFKFKVPQLKGNRVYSLKICALPGNKIAVLDGISTELYVTDPVSSDTQVFSLLRLPEVKRSWESYEPEARGPAPANDGPVQFARAVIIPGLSATPQGDVYLTLTGFTNEEGAVVLRIDQQGNLIQSLRCVLPKMETRRSADNPEGYAGSFGSIGTTRSYLFVVGADGDVLKYQR